MSSYEALALSSRNQLAKRGMAVTLQVTTAGAYNTASGTSSTTVTDDGRVGVMLDFGPGQTSVRGSLIEQADKRLLLDAIGTAPKVKDRIKVGTDVYAIISVGEVSPAAVPVLYDLHLRK